MSANKKINWVQTGDSFYAHIEDQLYAGEVFPIGLKWSYFYGEHIDRPQYETAEQAKSAFENMLTPLCCEDCGGEHFLYEGLGRCLYCWNSRGQTPTRILRTAMSPQ